MAEEDSCGLKNSPIIGWKIMKTNVFIATPK
jgi:hypothetical protein